MASFGLSTSVFVELTKRCDVDADQQDVRYFVLLCVRNCLAMKQAAYHDVDVGCRVRP